MYKVVVLQKVIVMANKIFISYKYYDKGVYQDPLLDKIPDPVWPFYGDSGYVTPRSYVNELSNVLSGYAIEKWEKDGEDLSSFKDSTIASKLRDKIFDSSITIVLVSPNMKELTKYERDQWIPWEISYSLKEISRNGRTSKSNGIVVVVLPDADKSYDYCIKRDETCGIDILRFSDISFFKILEGNFFNSKNPNRTYCYTCNSYHYYGNNNHYFIHAKWCDFVKNPGNYIDLALEHQEHIDDYNIQKEID